MILHQHHNSRGNYNYNAFTYTNRGYAPHFHKNFELIYVKEGNLRLTVNGRCRTVSEGSFALILSNQIHSFDSENRYVIWVAVFAEQFVPNFAAHIEKYEGDDSIFECSESVRKLITDNMINADTEPDLFMKKACFYAVCHEYLKHVTLCEKKGRNDELVSRILDYISKYFAEDISLADVSSKFGYEYHYLSRLLNKTYNINFSDLVNQYRTDKAIRLLTESDVNGGGPISMSDIAMESGFKSIRNFNYVFKRVTGVSPGEYRYNVEKRIENTHSLHNRANISHQN